MEPLPSWGLISTESAAVGPRLIFFFFKGGNEMPFIKIVNEESDKGRGGEEKLTDSTRWN